MAKRLYIIGPVTGLDGLNREAFERARRRLTEAGYVAAIPHDKVGEDDGWRTAMSKSIREMLSMRFGRLVYDGVAELPQCIGSKGARCERGICEQLGIPHRPVDEWVRIASSEGGDR